MARTPPLTPRVPATIWIVDDSPTQAMLTQNALADVCSTECFLDGMSAIERLASTAVLPELVLLDWVMPDMSGDEVCRFIRATPRTTELPVVILTASRTATENIVQALESGANDILAKPFVPQELRARVRSILRAGRHMRDRDRARSRIVTFNKLGRALLTTNGDIGEILNEIAGAVVGDLVDGCAICVSGVLGTVQPVFRHRDPSLTPLLAPFVGRPAHAAQVFASGVEALAALPAALHGYVLGPGVASIATLEIPVRGLVQTTATFVRDLASAPFDERDLAALHTCLDLAALAIESAIRLEGERATMRFHEQMVGIVSHDLRTPLGAIAMGFDMLRDDCRDLPHARGILDRLDHSTHRMSSIVDQLLDVTRTRIGTGIALIKKPMQMRPAVSGVLDELRMRYPNVTLELSGGDVAGSWDPDRLEQVVSNLASNAVQYGRNGTPIFVDLAHTDEQVTIAVHNTNRAGPIPPDLLATLFEPFKRGHRASHPGGLGLGLYISSEIVRAHGGALTVESDAAGTTFRISLPRA